MNDFKKNNRFGGGNDRRGGGFGGGFGGGKRDFGGNRPFELFSATCASCGKTCEVPFKPNGKKPVYCKECFAANGGPAAGADSRDGRDLRGGDRPSFAPRREFATAPTQTFHASAPSANNNILEVKKQIENLNAKMDRIVTLLMESRPQAAKAVAAPVKAEAVAVTAASTEETPAKKAAKKPKAKKK